MIGAVGCFPLQYLRCHSDSRLASRTPMGEVPRNSPTGHDLQGRAKWVAKLSCEQKENKRARPGEEGRDDPQSLPTNSQSLLGTQGFGRELLCHETGSSAGQKAMRVMFGNWLRRTPWVVGSSPTRPTKIHA